MFPGQGTKCDVYRDLRQGRLQRQAAVPPGGRRAAGHGVHRVQEGRPDDGGHPEGHASAGENDGRGRVLVLSAAPPRKHHLR